MQDAEARRWGLHASPVPSAENNYQLRAYGRNLLWHRCCTDEHHTPTTERLCMSEHTCDCGCGRTPLMPGKRYLCGHAARHKSALAQPVRHPRRQVINGQIRYSHVLNAEQALGKPLPPKAVVHHVDSNRWNNANTNLVICQDQHYHMLIHVRTRIVRAGGNPNTQKICCCCKQMLVYANFCQSRRCNDGLHETCRECQKIYRESRQELAGR